MNIICPFFIFGKYGGVRVMTNILNTWADNNKVTIVTVGDKEPYFPLSDKIEVVICKNKKEIVKLLYDNFFSYDAIIGVYVISVFLIFIASLLRHDFSKNYYYIQAYEADKDFADGSWLWLKLVRISYYLPFHRIVNAPIYRNYKSLKAEDIVFPGLDLNLFYPKNTHFFNKTLKVGCIGRTEQWKGTQDVCDAIEILNNKGIAVEFYIAFNDYETVKHHFVKPDGDENLSVFYREMDVIVAPGHIQLGAVHYPVIESMAVGTSVITTGYFPADDTNAYIVEVQKPEQIANAIIDIVNNRDLAIKKRKKAIKDIQQFAWENVADKFMSIIEREINKYDNAK